MESSEIGPGEHYRIDTPERLDLDYDVASLGSRLLASLVDTILQGILSAFISIAGSVAIVFIMGIGSELLGSPVTRIDPGVVGIGIVALMVLFGFLVFWGYYVFFEMVWNGQSPGKRWVGLRVIREGGYPIGFSESAIRNLVRLVDFLPVYYGLGAVVMFIDRRSRRLGDLAAGTLVVKERRDIRLESLELGTVASFPSALVDKEDSFPNAHLLTAADLSLLREYLLRRPSLSPEAASRLSAQLAETFSTRMGYDLAGEVPEAFLGRLARHTSAAREP